MNLVGNSCLASYITRDFLHQRYVNPFCWCIMDFDSCFNLVKYWDSINFGAFKLVKDADWNFSIIIDEKVKVQYVHYIYDPACTEIKTHSPDVRYNKIWEYIVKKYVDRIACVKNEPPVFLFATANYGLVRHRPFTLQQQHAIESLDTPHTIIFSFKENIVSQKVKTISQREKFYDNGPILSKYLYSMIFRN